MLKPAAILASAAALLAIAPAAPVLAQAAVVDLGTAVRCSAAFGIAAADQARGEPSARDYPPLGLRGREFFVQTGARLMDEQKLTRDQVQARMRAEVQKLQSEAAASADRGAAMRRILTPCLTLLNATVPAR
ncbi:hypothetical protein [Novosphingobium sp.]|jgi:hypothetical protein|uniref:hypothetical protein n=1 Tax=Novosphingobium sp. TaxID=1874826 RepID=UPI001ECF16FB|nr:hypothetical protein [Novosphingobium sp.]MBK6801934.1 hypothetical protein [Novosphingobium sp.]MBK9010224.1 hypothetical protein [Novosphingobium sp.]